MAEFTENQPTDFRQGADGEMDTRRKILIGEAVLAKVQRGDWSQSQLNELLRSELKTDQADRAGAFQEDALCEGDALASTDDLAALENFGAESINFEGPPAFIMDGPPSDDLPAHFTTLLNPDAIAALARKRAEGR